MMIPKDTRLELPKLLAHAKGHQCMARLRDVCVGGNETSVPAHSNDPAHSKGIGRKAHDCYVVFVCMACHDWLDGRVTNPAPKEDRQYVWELAYMRQILEWLRTGVLVVG